MVLCKNKNYSLLLSHIFSLCKNKFNKHLNKNLFIFKTSYKQHLKNQSFQFNNCHFLSLLVLKLFKIANYLASNNVSTLLLQLMISYFYIYIQITFIYYFYIQIFGFFFLPEISSVPCSVKFQSWSIILYVTHHK